MDVPLPIACIRRLSQDPVFVAAVRSTYDALDQRIAARSPVCTNRGECCLFSSFGHTLFVTSVELAYFLANTDEPLSAPAHGGSCPYQVEGRCTTRRARPAGCRIFFCDPRATEWQPVATESVLRRLQAIGERFHLAYAYIEWTDALRQLGGAVRPPTGTGAEPGAIDSPLGAS